MSGRVFTARRPIAFGDVDFARILYYPRLFHYCHMAFEDFTEEAFGMPYVDFLEREKRGFPTAHVEADYSRPIPYGVELELLVTLQRLGRRSMVVRYRGRAVGEDDVRVEAKVTNVLVDMDSFTSTPITDRMRDQLAPYLEG